MPLVTANNTPLGVYEYIEYFKRIYFEKFSTYPSHNACLVTASQLIIEHLWLSTIWNYNFGNITQPDESKPYWSLKAPEYINNKWEERSLRYTSLTSFEDGIEYYIEFLCMRYKGAFDLIHSGTPEEFASALKARKYYTAPLDMYSKNMRFAYSKINSCYTKIMDLFGNRSIAFNTLPLPYSLIEERKRDYVLEVCNRVVPSKFTPTLDTVFSYVTQGRQRFKNYSSCADLAHFIIWCLGCTDEALLNRTDAELGSYWEVGKNISKLVSGGKNLGCWRTLKDGVPKPGDIVLIGDYSKKQMEHILVVENWEGYEVKSFDYGQFETTHCSKKVTRKFDGKSLNGRIVIGYIDIDCVPLTRYALEIKLCLCTLL